MSASNKFRDSATVTLTADDRGDESVPAAAAESSDQLRTDPEIENNKIITLNQLILISHQRDQLSQSIKIVTLIKIKSDRTWSLW